MFIKFLVFLILLNISYAQVIASKDIYYNQRVTQDNTTIKNNIKNTKCKLMIKSMLNKNEYISVHYIKKNTPICIKDVRLMSKNKVIYTFGDFIEVEEYGNIITETNKYIKIKKSNGKIRKLIKDGLVR